ncbi:alpha/beta hydrolase fold-3 [Verticillium dahliae VdLs.17]|uniref:Alpha/beta hydrolase fold-3 n=1 Tax=Verticillium dahliae (strain VdLs.17 / ATCC MYA-4575 / FGSC 10137) TaxID=498257 RepID=G2X3D4_VERDV|nr:alpha/beta hydrolase fold-3 [Verticillium dahliae VdLs.17]EGY23481.1 alpha/beta hydrolase fold-3 [Verticillium dahliae VdLs.17]
MPSPWSKQPLKILYLLFIVPATLLSLTYAVASGIFRGLRPDPSWSFRKAASVQLVKDVFLRHLCALRSPAPLSLQPGSEGDRFVLIPPAKEAQITGPADDAEIRPAEIGGTWTPAPVGQQKGLLVVLHFHGGAYVMGDGRDADTGFIAENLLQNTPCTHVFTPQYRLSNNPGGRFPAALQDALSAYSYLLNDVGISASNIVFSGDSAGANLAIAMLSGGPLHFSSAEPIPHRSAGLGPDLR